MLRYVGGARPEPRCSVNLGGGRLGLRQKTSPHTQRRGSAAQCSPGAPGRYCFSFGTATGNGGRVHRRRVCHGYSVVRGAGQEAVACEGSSTYRPGQTRGEHHHGSETPLLACVVCARKPTNTATATAIATAVVDTSAAVILLWWRGCSVLCECQQSQEVPDVGRERRLLAAVPHLVSLST